MVKTDMQVKRITCPKCSAILDVKNSNNEAVKVITCPSCKTMLRIKFAIETASTQLAGSLGGETQLVGASGNTTLLNTPSPKKDVSAQLVYGGKEYQLSSGENIVGRKAMTSNASVQIETSDRYMSRQHCIINISTMHDGTKKVVLSNYQNKNTTSVDGQEIADGDAIRLTDGDSITMGHTTVTFKMS